MDKNLLILFQEELFNEAKRIVPLVYDEKEVLLFNIKNYKKYINKKYKLFSIDIELFLIGLCEMKFDGIDWEYDKLDMKKNINHHIKVLNYDKTEFGTNVEETIDNVAKEIVSNYSKYKNKSLFEVMPKLVTKYMKAHNDSVEHKAYILYLNNALKKYAKYLPTTNLCDLQNT